MSYITGVKIIYRSIFERKYSPPRRVRYRQYDNPSFKFVAPGDIANDLARSHSALSKKLRTEFNVDVSVRDAKPPLKDSESVVVIFISSGSDCADDFRKTRQLH